MTRLETKVARSSSLLESGLSASSPTMKNRGLMAVGSRAITTLGMPTRRGVPSLDRACRGFGGKKVLERSTPPIEGASEPGGMNLDLFAESSREVVQRPPNWKL